MSTGEGATEPVTSKSLGDRQHFVVRAYLILSLFLFSGGVTAIIAEALLGTVLVRIEIWVISLAAIAIGSLGWQLSRLLMIWRKLQPTLLKLEQRRSEDEKRIVRRGFREIHYYLVGNLLALAALSFASANYGALGFIPFQITSFGNETSDPIHVAILIAALLLSFVPVLIAAIIQETTHAESRSVPVLRDDVISPFTLIIMSIGTALIVALAWAAGANLFSIQNDFGVIVIAAVLSAFILFIIAPHISRYLRDRSENTEALLENVKVAGVTANAPAHFVSYLDSILVRFVAPLSGATQNGVPHILVLVTVIALSALGYVIAAPYGLLPIILATMLIIGLGRRWAWIEEDRETASRLETQDGSEIHIGFSNDLKDEALLGYASLFVLVPLILFQLQSWTGTFTETGSSTGNAFYDWLRFFGAELAKAVPFVDWWEIYSVEIDTPFDASQSPALAKHLTFASRAVVDLVIMAALFQALSIWQRRRAQHKLYDNGHLNAFDPFTERSFFRDGMRRAHDGRFEPKRSFANRVASHVHNREEHQGQRLPYSHRRLNELIYSDDDEIRDGALWMIKEFDVLAGDPRVQLSLFQQHLSQQRIPQLAAMGTVASRRKIHGLKMDLERITQDYLSDQSWCRDTEIGKFASILKDIKGAPEFAYAHALIIELLGKQTSELATLVLSDHLLQDHHIDRVPRIIGRIVRTMMVRPGLFLEQTEMRIRVYDALEAIAHNKYASDVAVRTVREICTVMATEVPKGDRSEAGRRRARRVLDNISQS
jgi:hypothetical protein